MGFKLGKGYKNYMINGSLRTKLRFGQEAGDDLVLWVKLIWMALYTLVTK